MIKKILLVLVATLGLAYLTFLQVIACFFNPAYSSIIADSLLAYVIFIVHGIFFLVTIVGYIYTIRIILKLK